MYDGDGSKNDDPKTGGISIYIRRGKYLRNAFASRSPGINMRQPRTPPWALLCQRRRRRHLFREKSCIVYSLLINSTHRGRIIRHSWCETQHRGQSVNGSFLKIFAYFFFFFSTRDDTNLIELFFCVKLHFSWTLKLYYQKISWHKMYQIRLLVDRKKSHTSRFQKKLLFCLK